MTEYHVIKPANYAMNIDQQQRERSIAYRLRSGSPIFVNHEYDYRPNQTTRKSYYQLIIKSIISEKRN